jgi:hypothetical protein
MDELNLRFSGGWHPLSNVYERYLNDAKLIAKFPHCIVTAVTARIFKIGDTSFVNKVRVASSK